MWIQLALQCLILGFKGTLFQIGIPFVEQNDLSVEIIDHQQTTHE